MPFLLTCDRYMVIRQIPREADAPAECRTEELARSDGFAVIAMDEGRIVADAEGWFGRCGELSYVRNAHVSVGGEAE